MSVAAVLLIAAAATAHAAWNFFAKQARGGLAFVWVAGLCAVVVYAPAAAIQLAVGEREVSWTGVAFMVGSGILHTFYFSLL